MKNLEYLKLYQLSIEELIDIILTKGEINTNYYTNDKNSLNYQYKLEFNREYKLVEAKEIPTQLMGKCIDFADNLKNDFQSGLSCSLFYDTKTNSCSLLKIKGTKQKLWYTIYSSLNNIKMEASLLIIKTNLL